MKKLAFIIATLPTMTIEALEQGKGTSIDTVTGYEAES